MTHEYLQLQKKIWGVRARLKWIACAKGLAMSLALSLAILIVAVYAADHWNYTSTVVNGARVFSILGIGLVFGWFLLRQLMIEGIVLAVLGGVAGLVIATWISDLAVRLGPENILRLERTQLDFVVFAVTLGVSVLTGLLFSLKLPTWQIVLGIYSASPLGANRTAAG